MSGPLVLDQGCFGSRIPSSVNCLDPQRSKWLPKRTWKRDLEGKGKNLFGMVHTQEAENSKKMETKQRMFRNNLAFFE